MKDKSLSTQIKMLSEERLVSERAHGRMMELEGECKIERYTFMRLNLLKAIPLTIVLTLSLFGLFALKYSAKLRKKVFYTDCEAQKATHLHIEGSDNTQQNQRVQRKYPQIEFFYRKVKYLIKNSTPIPQGFSVEDHFEKITKNVYLNNGLNQEEVVKLQEIYGKNEHLVDIPFYFQFLLDKMTTPFFVIQDIFSIIYIITGFLAFGVALLALTIITTSVNYVFLYFSYLKIRKMAEKNIEIKVIRENKIEIIDSRELVPGDVIIPEREVPCDSLMVKGTAFMSEANLTGETSPIGKFPVVNLDSIYDNQCWLYEGSSILQITEHPRAIVINTGFISLKGRIIRRILTREIQEPRIFNSALIFLALSTLLVGIASYGAYIGIAKAGGLALGASWYAIVFIDNLSSFIPAPLPIYFNLNYSFSLARLRWKGISGTEAEKSVVGAHTKIMCFDKTGTITEEAVRLKQIIDCQNLSEIQDFVHKSQRSHILDLFATCHTTREINDQFYGDQIDKEMYKFSGYQQISKREDKNPQSSNPQPSTFIFENQKGSKLQVLRVNQFESRFQSMSVLVRNLKTNQLLVYQKGSPEKMYQNSKKKPKGFFEYLQKLSLEGSRTLGIGMKKINESQLGKYRKADRKLFEEQINLIGLVTFQNEIKEQAFQTIKNLKDSNIESKLITGDNLYIGVETAMRVGIINEDEKIVVIEGRNQAQISEKVMCKVISNKKENQSIEKVSFSLDELKKVPVVAADNDFFISSMGSELVNCITVFARTPPESKALIVKKLKEKFIKQEEELSLFEKAFNMVRPKVGMCGDGANDLLALKEADLSLGLQAKDASYGANFRINELSDVTEVIRQSKNAVSSVIYIFQFVASSLIASRIGNSLMISNAATDSSTARIYYSFASLLTLPMLLPLSRPSEINTPGMPNPNFMQKGNQMVIWGNTIIVTVTFIAGYLYFRTTDDFQPTDQTLVSFQSQPSQETADNTVLFLVKNLIWTTTAVLIYWGYPWKEPFYKNIPFLVLFLLNLIASIAYFFTTASISDVFSVHPVSIMTGEILFVITLGQIIVNTIYQSLLHYHDLHIITW